MIQTDIIWQVTDTFGGEANYSWVKEGTIACKPGEDYSDLAAVRRVKKAIGWSGAPTKTERWGDGLRLLPKYSNQVCFIDFNSHGVAK